VEGDDDERTRGREEEIELIASAGMQYKRTSSSRFRRACVVVDGVPEVPLRRLFEAPVVVSAAAAIEFVSLEIESSFKLMDGLTVIR